MEIWIVTVGEPLPNRSMLSKTSVLPKTSVGGRLFRSGVLAEKLASRGHQVTWWTSNFDHFTKQFHQASNNRDELLNAYRLILIPGPAYQSNIGIRRLINHLIVALRFGARIKRMKRPDLILCSYPTIELSWISTRFAEKEQIPCVIDIRDLWPDIFVQIAPKSLQWSSVIGLSPF